MSTGQCRRPDGAGAAGAAGGAGGSGGSGGALQKGPSEMHERTRGGTEWEEQQRCSGSAAGHQNCVIISIIIDPNTPVEGGVLSLSKQTRSKLKVLEKIPLWMVVNYYILLIISV